MSNIDERIVEMKFNNHLFEKNAQTSISTLEKLKQALKFDGVDKNLANLDKSVNAMDFSRLSAGIDSLNKRFSTMGIVGMTVIQDLTRAAENMAQKMATGLFNQIKTGGWARATNIDQAKFQLEGLGVAWDKIVADIEYGVNDTAYGLDSAAKVASQLVASGIQIGDDMKGALRGVSGVAAMTNSSYDEIGAIFTTVAGQGKLMTMQLRQLESRGLNVAANLGKASGELAGKTEAEIRDMVTKGKIDFLTFAKAMDEVFGPQAKKANETFEGSLANMKSALSRIGAEFATPIRKGMIPVFNQLRVIFNDIKKIKMGQVFKDFVDFADKASNFATSALKNVDLSWLDNLIDKLHEAYVWFDTLMSAINPMWKRTAEVGEETVETTTQNVEAMKKIEEIAEEVRNGKWGSGDARKKALEDAGYVYEAVQNKVNELEGSTFRYTLTEEQLAKAAETTGEAQEKTMTVEEQRRQAMQKASEEQIKQQAEIEKANRRAEQRQKAINTLLEHLKPVADGAASAFNVVSKSVKAVAEGAFEPMIRIGTSIGSIFLDIAAAIGRVFTEIDETLTATGGYEKIEKSVNSFLTGVADKLEAVAELVSKVTSGKSIADVIKEAFSGLSTGSGMSVGDTVGLVTTKLKEFLGLITDAIFGEGTLSIDNLASKLGELVGVIPKLIPLVASFLGGKMIFNAAKGISSFGRTLGEIPNYVRSINRQNNASALFTLAKAIGVITIAFFALSQLSWEQIGKGAVAIIAIAGAIGALFAIISKLSSFNGKNDVTSIIGTYVQSLANNNNANSIFRIAEAFGILSGSLLALSQLSWEQLGKAGVALIAIGGAIGVLMYALNKTGNSGQTVRGPFTSFLNNIAWSVKSFLKQIGTATLVGALAVAVYAIGQTVIALSEIPWDDGVKALVFLGIILGELFLIVAGLNEVAKESKGGSFGIAILMGALALVVKSLGGTLEELSAISWDDGVKALVLMGILFAELFLVVAGISESAKTAKGGAVGIAIVMGVLALVVKSLSGTLQDLAGIDFLSGVKGLVLLGALMAELYLVVAGISKVAKESDGGTLGTALIMGVLALVVKSLSKTLGDLAALNFDAGVRGLVLLGVLLGELFLIVAGITEVANNAKTGAVGTSLLMGVLALVIKSLSKTLADLASIDFEAGLKGCALLGILMAELVAALFVVSKMKGGGSIKAAASIAIVLGVLGLVLGSLTSLDSKKLTKASKALSRVMLSVTAMMLGFSTIAKVKKGDTSNVKAALIGVTVLIAEVAGILTLMSTLLPDQAVNRMPKIADSLSDMMIGLGVLMAGFGVLRGLGGGDWTKGDTISVGIIAALGVLSGILTAIGAWLDEQGKLEDAIDKIEAGIPFAKSVGEAIGAIFNGIMTGFLGFDFGEAVKGLVDDVKNLPTYLKDWIDKLLPLAESLEKVGTAFDEGEGISFAGVTDQIGKITGDIAVIAESLNKIKTSGSKPEDIDAGIGLWITKLAELANSINLGDIDTTGAATKLEEVKDMMSDFSDIIAMANGEDVSGYGGKAFKGFTNDRITNLNSAMDQLKTFATKLKEFSTNLTGFSSSSVTDAENAITLIMRLSREGMEIGQGSIIGQAHDGSLIGNGSIDYFAQQLVPFAQGIKKFAEEISGMSDYTDAVTGTKNSASIIQALADNANDIGKNIKIINDSEGLTNGMELFSGSLEKFGEGMKKYSQAIDGMSSSTVKENEDACKIIMDLAAAVPDQNGGLLKFLGGNDMEMFNANLPGLGTAIYDFCANMAGANATDATTAIDTITKLSQAFSDVQALGQITGGDALQGSMDEMTAVVGSVFQNFAWALEDVGGGEALASFSSAMQDFGKTLGEEVSTGMVEGLKGTDGGAALQEAMGSLVSEMISGIGGEGSGTLAMPEFETLFSEMVAYINTQQQLFRQGGQNLANALSGGVRQGRSWVTTALQTIGTAGFNAINAYQSRFRTAGRNLAAGLAGGIRQGRNEVVNAARDVVAAANTAAQQEAGENSPSKVWDGFGAYMDEGMANGIRKNIGLIVSAAKGSVNAANKSIEGDLSSGMDRVTDNLYNQLVAVYQYINSVINESTNINPVITPVVDLSQVQNGMYSAGAMLSSAGNAFGAGALSYARSNFPGSYSYGLTSQGASNVEVVRALNGVRSDLKDLGEALSSMDMVLDNGALVGQMGTGMDKQLGTIQKFKERWA